MKTCPICHAVAFDDAQICYGCLHRFDAEEAPRPAAEAQQPGSEGQRCGSEEQPAIQEPPAIPRKEVWDDAPTRFEPVSKDGEAADGCLAASGWVVRIEVRGAPAFIASEPGEGRFPGEGSDPLYGLSIEAGPAPDRGRRFCQPGPLAHAAWRGARVSRSLMRRDRSRCRLHDGEPSVEEAS